MWCSALSYRTGRNSVDFKGKSDDTIYGKKLSVILRIRSANVGEDIRWKGMYAYGLNQDNRVGWKVGSSSRTTIFSAMKGLRRISII